MSVIQNNDILSPETYTNDLINSKSAQTICNVTSQFQAVDVMARLFVGELPIRWRRMSRGVLYYQQYDCFSKAYSGWKHTKHPNTKHYCSSVRKPPIISGLSLQKTSNSGSVLMSSCHDAGIVLTWFGSLVRLGPPGSRLTSEALIFGLVVWLNVFYAKITHCIWLAVASTCKCKLVTKLSQTVGWDP